MEFDTYTLVLLRRGPRALEFSAGRPDDRGRHDLADEERGARLSTWACKISRLREQLARLAGMPIEAHRLEARGRVIE
jgi:hypothetical protein